MSDAREVIRRAAKKGETITASGWAVKRPRQPRQPQEKCPYRCHTCGETFPDYPPAERHMDRQHGLGGRLEAMP